MADEAFVGIDLAWGTRARTGVAVADASGRLVASTSVRTDVEILGFVEQHAGPGPVVAAIDAPLVVRNATGRRPCEAEVQQMYGRYGAGAYPANLTNPSFAAGTRGATVCQGLGLDLLVGSAAARRAIEVYPHPAMVVLFDLQYVIPYKAKQGRSFDSLKNAFERLMTLMEHHLPELGLPEHPRWQELRRHCGDAGRKSELGAVEDEIDAIFCAHLAHLWHRDDVSGNDVLGDDDTGCMVVPRPQRPLPSARRPPRSGDIPAKDSGPDLSRGVAGADNESGPPT